MPKFKEPLLGLDIGLTSIKAIQLEENGKLYRYGIVPTPKDSIKDGVIIDPGLIAEAIRELFTAYKIKTKEVNFAATEKMVTMRMLKLPPMPKQEMKEVIRGEIEHYGLFSAEQTLFDFCILEEITEEGLRKESILCSITSGNKIEPYISIANNLELVIRGIELKSFSIVRSLSTSNFNIPPEEIVALIILGEETTEIDIFKGKIPQFIRSIEIGGKIITSGMAGIEESTPVLELVNEIRRSIGFYEVQLRGKLKFKKAILVPEEECRGLDTYLTQRLNIPCEFAHPLKGFAAEDLKTKLPCLTIATGLAMKKRGIAKEVRETNLLLIPQEKRVALSLKEQLLFFILPCLILFSSFLLLSIFYSAKNNSFKKQIVPIEEELNQANSVLSKIGDEKIGQLKEKEGLRSIAGILERSRAPLAQALNEIRLRIPKDVWIVRISQSGNVLEIKGRSLSQDSILRFTSALNASICFSRVNLCFSEGRGKDIKFLLSCQLPKVGTLEVPEERKE